MCWETVQSALKDAGGRFVRARRVPGKTPPESVRVARERALKKFLALEEQGRCQVLFGDESGFALSPSVPYVWQMPGYPLHLPAHPHHKRHNVLGFWRSDNWMRYSAFSGRMNAARFIECIEHDLLPHLNPQHPTILVLDNAPVHKAKKVWDKLPLWKAQGLRVFFLPTYSPHLNRIELLWRQVKYRWLEPCAYENFPALVNSVNAILDQVGTKYLLSFS